MEDPDLSKPFVVIQFDEILENNKVAIELVPTSWLSFCQGVWHCKYPQKKDYPKINKWVQDEKAAEKDWVSYPGVKILKTAGNYERGLRRLEKACTNLNQLDTTEVESEACTTPAILSGSQMKNLLETRVKMTGKSSTSGTGPVKSMRKAAVCDSEDEELASDSVLANKNYRVVTDTPCSLLGARDENQNLPEIVSAEFEFVDTWKIYIDKKMEALDTSLGAKINAAKRSILYDFDKKITEVKNTILMSIGQKANDIGNPRAAIGTTLPIKTLDDFLDFDSTIATNVEIQQALKSLMNIVTAGSMCSKTDIAKIISSLITKDVQLLYSGCGRTVKGVGKRNFSKTSVYDCIKEFIAGKYAEAQVPVQIAAITSRYLADALDREGGRRVRGTVREEKTSELSS